MKHLGCAAPVQLGRTAGAGGALAARRLDEALGVRDLPAEVPRIELGVPHDLVDIAQVADGELGAAEGGGERGELQARQACFTASSRI